MYSYLIIFDFILFILTLSFQIKALEYGHSSVVNELRDEGGDDGGNEGGDESKFLDNNMIVHCSDISDLEDDNYTSDGEFSLFQFDTDVSS